MKASVRPLRLDEIEPHLPLLVENGFTPEIEQGVWIGAFDGTELAGFVRVFSEGGAFMLEDVFVFDAYRKRGFATMLVEEARCDIDHLWLICDDEMTGFYERRGFALARKKDFPKSLASLYRAKSEWPAAHNHNHNAMVWRRA